MDDIIATIILAIFICGFFGFHINKDKEEPIPVEDTVVVVETAPVAPPVEKVVTPISKVADTPKESKKATGGDIIELDVANKKLTLHVDKEELNSRQKKWKAPAPVADRGYVHMYINNVDQAHSGCDFTFLKGGSGPKINRDNH